MNQAILEKPTEVRATVNEKNFFSSMKHLFATSHSLLAELMQNARRAGASFVAFDLDKDTATLTIADDGCGVDDFSKLLALCESGWDEQTMLSDKPFGMGFFSTFFACESITVRSKGKKLVAKLNDIVSKRALSVDTDSDPVKRGTVLVMQGVQKELIGEAIETDVVLNHLKSYAMGFPIDVRYNGESLPRPHAMQNLKTDILDIGHVYNSHIQGDGAPDDLYRSSWGYRTATAFYLQGLPIERENSEHASSVVHLNGERFIPLMPDRKRLYDAAEQNKVIEKSLDQYAYRFLLQRKEAMGATDFVRAYWDVTRNLGMMDVFNDVPYIPADELQMVCHVMVPEFGGLRCIGDGGELVSREEIASGKLKVWRNVSDSLDDDPFAGVILKVMQRNKIHAGMRHRIHEGHWLNRCTLDASEFVVQIESSPVKASDRDYIGNYSIEARLVDEIRVKITSKVDSGFLHEEVITDDWMAYLANGVNEDEGDDKVVCLLCGTDKSPDHPVDFMSNFEDEHDSYQESWCEDAKEEWDLMVARMKGAGFHEILAAKMPGMVQGDSSNLGALSLAYAKEMLYKNSVCVALVDLENAEVWEKFSSLLQQGGKLDAQALKQAFIEATGATPVQPEEDAHG